MQKGWGLSSSKSVFLLLYGFFLTKGLNESDEKIHTERIFTSYTHNSSSCEINAGCSDQLSY